MLAILVVCLIIAVFQLAFILLSLPLAIIGWGIELNKVKELDDKIVANLDGVPGKGLPTARAIVRGYNKLRNYHHGLFGLSEEVVKGEYIELPGAAL